MAITRGKTTQFQVSVPTKSAKRIQKVADKMGVSEAAFTAVALVVGARLMERQFSPESFMPQSLIDALAKAGVDVAKEQAAEAAGLNETA